MIKIHFNIHKHVDYGQALFVSGNFPHIGSWTLEKAIRLNWSEVSIFLTKRVIIGQELSKYKEKV